MERGIRPINKGVERAVLLSLAVMIIALGTAIFSFTFLLISVDLSPTFYGLVIIWIGSIAFFYSVITEEHTMKQLFLRQGFFFTGLTAMIMGMLLVAIAGLSYPNAGRFVVMEFGLLILIMGAALVLLSAQKTRDYSRRSGLFAAFAGLLLLMGGLLAGSVNASYAGIFILLFSAVWLGMRSRTAI